MSAFRLLVVTLPALALLVTGGCAPAAPATQADYRDLLPTAPQTDASAASAELWVVADRPREFRFPADHGAHPDYRIEWWYYTGNLRTAAGRQFGYQLTFFRTGLQFQPDNPSRWAVRDLYTAHFAVSDVTERTHRFWQRNRRAGIGMAGCEEDRLRVWNGNWRAEQSNDEQQLFADEDDCRIELSLRPVKPLVLHGQGGLSRKGAAEGNASYYYSFTRLQTSGVVIVDGTPYEVTGESWMDHEFSTSFLEPGQLGWDWFSIQFDDNTELMLYQMRRDDGSVDRYSSATFVAGDGQATQLSAAEFALSSQGRWHSDRSGAVYPLEWTVDIPRLAMRLEVRPTFAQQEMVTSETTGICYWEGGIVVTGHSRGVPVQGQGYLELTGYAGRGLGSLLER